MEKQEIVVPTHRIKPLIVDGEVFRSAYDFELTKKDLEQAYLELGETEQVRRSSLQALKQKLSETENLHHHTDDEILLRYLRYQKFDVDKAYAKLCMLYRVRSDYPEEFDLPSNLEDILSLNIATFFPYRTEEGCFMNSLDFRQFDADTFTPVKAAQLINVFGDAYSVNPGMQVNRLMCIWDMRGFTARHCLKYFNPVTARRLLRLLLECYPWRVKNVLMIHCSPLAHTAFRAVRYFLKKKMADRVVFMGSDMSELHQYINPRILPKEYGGDIEDCECFIKDFALKNMSFMKYERSFKFMPS